MKRLKAFAAKMIAVLKRPQILVIVGVAALGGATTLGRAYLQYEPSIAAMQQLGASSSFVGYVQVEATSANGLTGGGNFYFTTTTIAADGCVNFAPTSGGGTWVRKDPLLASQILASQCDTLAHADAYAAAQGKMLVEDVPFTLAANTTFSAPAVYIRCSGLLTRATHTVTFSHGFTADLCDVFDASGTGAIRFGGALGLLNGETMEIWFGVLRNNFTVDVNAAKQAMLASGGYTLVEGAGHSLRSGWGTNFTPPGSVVVRGLGRGVTFDDYSDTGSFSWAFEQDNPNLRFEHLAISASGPTASGIQFMKWCGDNLSFDDVLFDGKMTASGGTINSGLTAFVRPCPTGSFSHLTVNNSVMMNAEHGYDETNTDTGTYDDVNYTNNVYSGMFQVDFNSNTPLANATHVTLMNNKHYGAVVTTNFPFPLGDAIAFGGDVTITGEKFTGTYYDALHLEGDIRRWNVHDNSVATNTNCISIISNNIPGSFSAPTLGDIHDNECDQVGTPLPNYVSATFNGYITPGPGGTAATLTVVGSPTGTVTIGEVIPTSAGVAPNTTIVNGSAPTWALNIAQTVGSSGSPVAMSASFPNFCIGLQGQNSQNLNLSQSHIHHNICRGAGYGAGLFSGAPQVTGLYFLDVSDNQFIQTAIGIDLPFTNTMGGMGFKDNVCNATPVCIRGTVVHLFSQKFINMDPAWISAVPFQGVQSTFSNIVIDHAQFEYGMISLASSAAQDYCLLRAGTSDSFGGSIEASVTARTNQVYGGLFEYGAQWISPTFSGGTAVGGATGVTIAVSKNTVGSVPCIKATVTNNIASTQTMYVTANIDGLYIYSGL